jgi:type IV secretory pathway VirD2 relaxase
VSPEDAGELDLAAYVRSLMARVERDVGQPLEWAAVNHYNTEHPHTHIVVRGVDREGRPVRFDRDYIARGMRERAQELATMELGPRRDDEVQRARRKELTQERFTSLDRDLERRIADGRVRQLDLAQRSRSGPGPDLLVGRLEVLEGMRLAERMGPGVWRLEPDWKRQLQALGDRADIIRQMHAAVRGDPARYRDLRPGDALPGHPEGGRHSPAVHGKVRAQALVDEMRGTFCAIVETPDGAAYRVPLDARAADDCRAGDFVELRSVAKPRHRPEDREIEALARASGRRCVPDAAPGHSGAPLHRRLRQLQALGVAAPDGPGAWRIPVPIAEALERLDRERPEHRLVVRPDRRSVEQQVRARGPVWLDGLQQEVLAPYGLGAELREALQQRAGALRSLGIDPADPRKLSKLRELERTALGERAAKAAGVAFVPHPPDGFRGRVAATPEAPGYAIITDGARMVALPMTRELRELVGRTVTLGRDASRKVRIAPAPDVDRGG